MTNLLGVLVVVLSVLVCALIIHFLKDVRFYIAMLLLISTPIILMGFNF
ncbi:hypothetical protein [Providencia rettgeri]